MQDDGVSREVGVLSFEFVEAVVEVVYLRFEVDDFLFVFIVFLFFVLVHLLGGYFFFEAIDFLLAVVEAHRQFLYLLFVLGYFLLSFDEFLGVGFVDSAIVFLLCQQIVVVL
jgi:hypothetical protein